ncbi:hypothetical protein [Trichodesmium erythraeum]
MFDIIYNYLVQYIIISQKSIKIEATVELLRGSISCSCSFLRTVEE